ncbi:tyrosine-type recombinase/integrase [Streptomyces sp. AP-93]|uniref:tyrosine-type recombinase/integrase n=1 Tax=Streptomyces sp. AP-93 TaxID=2929048 RepID=UPI001FAF7D51|nr:tyrosine-type recombinase/integrase [Streptomyces sp. AP-93]MCJ0869635.1 tyrosine-type recombinase/integrase [Streptomyces sp. AP-93]
MAPTSLAHGMGTVFKECGHDQAYWPRCPHPYKIRYRNTMGRQQQESGFTSREAAITRLVAVYNERKSAPANQTRTERLAKYGPMTFREYTREWKQGQRHLAPASLLHLDSLLEHHLFPALGTWRMDSFDHKVVEHFIRAMEQAGTGLATQANAFDKLKAILLDAHRLGIYLDSPLLGVQAPVYDPKRAVIPSPAQLRVLRTVGDDAFQLLVDLMSGCGLRNGEAAAVNLNNIVAADTYRVTEQVNRTTKQYDRLKHRKKGEHRDVPLPPQVKETIERYAATHGTVDGYLLRHPQDRSRPYASYLLNNQWRRIKQTQKLDMPDGMVLYGFRHFFASNCLAHRIPITDVAEWMGHTNLEITFKTYRHLMPGTIGQAAIILNTTLTA